jgi:hypothetical protein
VFHSYYNQLKVVIHSTPHIIPNTVYRFRPLMKFSADRHFLYIIVHVDEHKKQLQSYYILTEEYLEEITKEWLVDLLVPADPADISDVDSPETAQDLPGPSMQQKINEVQDLSSASVKTASITLEQEGDGEELEEVEQKHRDEVELLKKRKGSPQKYSSRKNSKSLVTKL